MGKICFDVSKEKRYTGIDTKYEPQFGNKIYEGDIVECFYCPDLQLLRGVVCFEDGKWVVKWVSVLIVSKWVNVFEIYEDYRKTDLSECVSYNILGNVYEQKIECNPEIFFIKH